VGVLGSGGKTTLLSLLARELSADGSRVLVTTSTKVYPFPGLPLLEDPLALPFAFRESRVLFLGQQIGANGKLAGPNPMNINMLREFADYILIEADGARRRPLKVHLPHDPVLPPGVDLAVMILGASAIGQPVSPELVHRLEHAPEHAPERWALREGKPLLAESAAKMALDRYREKAGVAPLRILVNQEDANPDGARELALEIRRRWTGPIIVGSTKPAEFKLLDSPGSRPALVMLAAGGSRRWPGDKRYALLGDRSVLDWSLDAWRNFALEDRILVLQLGDEKSAEKGRAAGFRPVVCEHAERGMSESLGAGIAAIGPDASGAMLALADMPALRPSTLRRLLAAAAETPDKVLRPRYNGRAGHPVYIPRERFDEITALTGDRGPRDVIDSWGPISLDLNDEGVVLDLDKPADADRLECLLMEDRKDDEAR
jgi:molybdenum cofactor cytidylyltransferase